MRVCAGWWLRAVGGVGLVFCAGMARAQAGGQASAQVAGQVGAGPDVRVQATGYVTGRVICGDTQHPARFAQVTLVAVSTASRAGDFGGGFGGRGSARTDLDGNYTATNIAAGDYYVVANATGYVSEGQMLQAAVDAGGDMTSLLASLPVVHVGTGLSTANLTLQRGAVIAGRALWDDGSAAAGVQVGAVLQPATTTASASTTTQQQRLPGGLGNNGQGGYAQTDDRGDYRLTGLAPGTYVVRATVQAPGPAGAGGGGFGGFGGGFARTSPILLYAPGKLRKSEATVLTMHAGEERDDVAFTMDLRALHTVTGTVSAASGGGSIASGSVRITDSQDTSLTRTAAIGADGSFTLMYVPAGTYSLSVPYASTASAASAARGQRGGRGGGTGTATSAYQPFQETLAVTDTDISGVAITLNPAGTQ